jgi:hypothetical protein
MASAGGCGDINDYLKVRNVPFAPEPGICRVSPMNCIAKIPFQPPHPHMPPTQSCDSYRMNTMSQSKARVPGQTALASLRECVADKKVGGRAKQALKDLTMHR